MSVIIKTVRFSEEDQRRLEEVVLDYNHKLGKQTESSVIRILINEKYRQIDEE